MLAANFFDDWFNGDIFAPVRAGARKVEDTVDRGYGKTGLMKTDVRENADGYEVEIELPGFKKDQIEIELKEGVLTISAAREEESEGKFIRRERYTGSSARSFYVGKNVTESDIRASLSDGVLCLSIPKMDRKKPEKHMVKIED